MATRTIFLTLTRSTSEIEWGFEFVETLHLNLGQALIVKNVQTSSPASKAGLLIGDIILGVDNSPITGRPLTLSIALELIKRRPCKSIELQILRDKANRIKKTKTYKIMNSDTHRPIPINRGVIPAVAQMDSGVRLPDNNVSQFLNEKAREQWAITKQIIHQDSIHSFQTYRSIPIIEPKPKVRRDWPMGSYLKYMEGPGWHDPPRHLRVDNPNKAKLLNDLHQGSDGQPLYHLQYNSPINLYSENNLNNSINPMNFLKILIKNHYILSAGSSTMGHTISPHPIYKVNSVKPETIDITHSPTYQYLQEERALKRKICDFHVFIIACLGPPNSSPFNHRHSPDPQQTPYFKTLMNTLNVPH
ncbi:hypothetical protein QR98_0035250 [Sarcoptes scabiei]|uniref:Uncharacterized protein n=1 Tax=Sarcoptes scabiei TaxID=52283 RepID=A0A132A203_SARSC|nr:hypothetical protein QR98_0035250 [Sarcoptes scabiei]